MKKLVFYTGMAFFFFSCNSGKKESSDSNLDDNTDQVSGMESNNSYDCFKKLEDDYSLLLSKDEMASVYKIDFDNAQNELRSGSNGENMYQWPSDRPDYSLEISGIKRELPDENLMGVKNLSFYANNNDAQATIASFNRSYTELSKEELDKLKVSIEKEQEEGNTSGDDLMTFRAEGNWSFVEGVGSSAWYQWNEQLGGELAVLSGNAGFTIISKISNSPDENQELAKKLAEKVNAKCK